MEAIKSLFPRVLKSLGFAAACCFAASASTAATITTTTEFEFSVFTGNPPGGPAFPFSTFEGSFTITYDTAVAETRKAVDAITISSPTGIYSTTDVFFDYNPDSHPVFQNFSVDVYFDEGFSGTGMSVVIGNSIPPDFLIQSAGLTDQPGGLVSAIALVTTDAQVFYQSQAISNNGVDPALTTTVTLAAVPLPASVALLIAAFGGFALVGRRRARAA